MFVVRSESDVFGLDTVMNKDKHTSIGYIFTINVGGMVRKRHVGVLVVGFGECKKGGFVCVDVVCDEWCTI